MLKKNFNVQHGGNRQAQGYTTSKFREQELPKNPDGSTDYLQVDPTIPGQNWVCMSFISPEVMMKKKELYYFNQFLYREVNKTLKDQAVHMAKEVNSMLRSAFEKRIERLEKSHNEDENRAAGYVEQAYQSLQLDEDEFANKCMHLYRADYDEIQDKFSMFQTQNSVEMDKKFDQENEYQCSVRGFKVRGAFNERKEAEAHCKKMREQMEPVHVFIAPMGYWCPWDPNPDAIQDSDYMVPALNELMGKYHDNMREKNKFFEDRKQEMMQDAGATNRERRKENIRKKLLDQKQAKIDQERKQAELKKRIEEGSKTTLPEKITDEWIKENFGDERKGKKNNKKK